MHHNKAHLGKKLIQFSSQGPDGGKINTKSARSQTIQPTTICQSPNQGKGVRARKVMHQQPPRLTGYHIPLILLPGKLAMTCTERGRGSHSAVKPPLASLFNTSNNVENSSGKSMFKMLDPPCDITICPHPSTSLANLDVNQI